MQAKAVYYWETRMHTVKLAGKAALLSVGIVCMAVFAHCAEPGLGEKIRTVADLNGKRLGAIVGTTLDSAANGSLDFTQIHYYNDSDEQIEALYLGEIDAFLDDEPVARFLAGRDSGLRVVEGVLMEDEYGYAMRLDDEGLYEKINPLLVKKIEDGTLRRLEKKWIDSSEGETAEPAPELSAGRILRFGVSPVSAPFVYKVKGRIAGLDIDLMRDIAESLGMRLEVVVMDFGELMGALQSGDVDVIGSCFSITEERKRLVRFTDSYYQGGVAAVTLE